MFYLEPISFSVVLVLDFDSFSSFCYYFWPTAVVRLNYFLTFSVEFESDLLYIELEPVLPISHEAGFLKRKPEYWF